MEGWRVSIGHRCLLRLCIADADTSFILLAEYWMIRVDNGRMVDAPKTMADVGG